MATTTTSEIQKLAHDILIDSFGTIYDTPEDAEHINRLIELGAVRRAEEALMYRQAATMTVPWHSRQQRQKPQS